MCLVCEINAMSMCSWYSNESFSLDGLYVYNSVIAKDDGLCYDNDKFSEYVTYMLQSMCYNFSITLNPL